MQNNLYPNLDKIRISKKTLEITNIVDQYNIKSVKFFQFRGVWVGAGWGRGVGSVSRWGGGGGVGTLRGGGGGVVGRWGDGG